MNEEIVFDVDELRAELAFTADEALSLADKLALEVVDSPRKTPDAFRLAREFQEKRVHMRRIRGALKVAVSG